MRILATLYAEDNEVLVDIAAKLSKSVATMGDPSEVSAPGSLDIDLATISQHYWEMLVVFGSVKGSLQAIELLARLIKERKTKGRTAKVELVGPHGSKLVIAGSMSAEELKKEIKKYRVALKQSLHDDDGDEGEETEENETEDEATEDDAVNGEPDGDSSEHREEQSS